MAGLPFNRSLCASIWGCILVEGSFKLEFQGNKQAARFLANFRLCWIAHLGPSVQGLLVGIWLSLALVSLVKGPCFYHGCYPAFPYVGPQMAWPGEWNQISRKKNSGPIPGGFILTHSYAFLPSPGLPMWPWVKIPCTQ